MRKGKWWKCLLNACDRRAFRRHCLRNRHATMTDIATWALLSLNTVHRCIKKYNLMYYAKRKAFINFAQKCLRVLWARSHLRWTERQWKCVFWSDKSTFQLVFGKNGHRILRAKDEKAIQTVTNEKCKNQPL